MFTETMLTNEEAIAASADPRLLLDRFLEWNFNLADSLKLLNLYCRVDEIVSKDAPFAEFEPEPESEIGPGPASEPEFMWQFDIDDAEEEIYALCSAAWQSGDAQQDDESPAEEPMSRDKLLILVRMKKPDSEKYTIPLSIMSALPEDLQPYSLDEVGYILFLDYDYVDDGLYDKGIRGIREYVEITLQTARDMGTINKWTRINGEHSPETFAYVGDPPPYKSGGMPDLDATRETCDEALEYLLALLSEVE